MWIPIFLGLCGQLAFADEPSADANEEYLLGDVGVRVDTPRGWKMLRWSDWDFKAETSDSAVMLFAWSTPFQIDAAESDLAAWATHATAKVEELDATDVEVSSTRLGQKGDLTIARAEVSFRFPQGAKGKLYWAGIPVDGQVFQMATLASTARASRAEQGLDEMVDRLEIRAQAQELAMGPRVEAAGISATLPGAWRTPLDSETKLVNPLLVPLGLEDLTGCWVAIRPQIDGQTDVMATCQGGLWLGIVDEHTFEQADAMVRERMFGSAEVPPGEPVQLADRVGFLYHPDLSGKALFVSAVPYDQGLARTWVLGPAEHAESLRADIDALVLATSYSGPHPATATEQASYWLLSRGIVWLLIVPVLGLGLVVGVGGGALMVMRGRRNPYADFDPDEHEA